MFSNAHVVFAFAVGGLLWGCFGFSIGGFAFADRRLRLFTAPLLGWAVHTAVSIPVLVLVGFNRTSVMVLAGLTIAAAILLWRIQPRAAVPHSLRHEVARLPWIAIAAAALLATLPSLATMSPKKHPEGIVLADPISDRAKVAIVSEIARGHIPPQNPFYAEAGHDPELVYYWGWHASAAQLSYLPRVNAWEADTGLSWFTTFASLLALMGAAISLCGRTGAAGWVVALSATSNIRPILAAALGPESVQALISPDADLGAWMNHAPWVPMHVASGACAVLAILLLYRLASGRGPATAALLGLVAAAAFATSTYIGGFVFVLAAIVSGGFLLVLRAERLRFAGLAVLSGIIMVLAVFPFLGAQLAALRGFTTSAVMFWRFSVIGTVAPPELRSALDPFAYWLFFLIEFPAVYVLGIAGAIYAARSRHLAPETRHVVLVLAVLILSGLGITACLRSVIASNDLGWRSTIPASMALTILAAATVAQWRRGRPVAIVGIVLFALGLTSNLIYARALIQGHAFRADPAFRDAPALWEAVRQHTGVDERVVINPSYLAKMTPWPTNISWGLMADRRSCFAAGNLAIPYSGRPLPVVARAAALIQRLFVGTASGEDVEAVAQRHDCHTVVFMPGDGAWTKDPLAASPLYSLADGTDRWRIYVRRP